ncbi:hypothetical protein KIN20_015418 [Parelaphostrongylus tenuis]|uniref:Uncharacterized protein n=1 Tax=Parelaphostrongylus tenuis TaxID=148309 RepID=A0AAD5QPV7_PARTN|nr:hypothetical protein KIN20_015418 [Parelaphostrongylus tenuis]
MCNEKLDEKCVYLVNNDRSIRSVPKDQAAPSVARRDLFGHMELKTVFEKVVQPHLIYSGKRSEDPLPSSMKSGAFDAQNGSGAAGIRQRSVRNSVKIALKPFSYKIVCGYFLGKE